MSSLIEDVNLVVTVVISSEDSDFIPCFFAARIFGREWSN